MKIRKNKLKKSVGLKIKERRKQLGLSQLELANDIETTSGYISMIEREVRFPDTRLLIKLADVLKVPASYFFSDNSDNIYEKYNALPAVDKKKVIELIDTLYAESYFHKVASEADSNQFPLNSIKRARFMWQKACDYVLDSGERFTVLGFNGILESNDAIDKYIRKEIGEETLWKEFTIFISKWQSKIQKDTGKSNKNKK
ncbi:MAG: helix-turn-helix domain-containing protein [Deltaproteobacteria bacterium]|jgi:transcriptional regulator with XRE-family HTH domain|nr:helix-turn-helix domain-containing protein [Deltaproteobacteria bacterium]